MKNNVRRLILLVLCGLGAFFAATVVGQIREQHLTSPYSIQYIQIWHGGKIFPDKLLNMSPEDRRTQAAGASLKIFRGRRGNGDSVEVKSEGTDNKDLRLRSIQFQRGIGVTMNNKNSSSSTTGYGVPETLYQNNDTCSSVMPENLKASVTTDTILGFKTFHFTETDAISTLERWIAPGLDCVTLRSFSTRKADSAQTILDALTASTDPPPDELFVVPGNLTDKKPSEFWLELFPPAPGQKASDVAQKWQRDDEIYAAEKELRERSTGQH